MSKVYDALILEDEPFQQERLLQLLENNFPDIQVLQVCNNGKEGLEALEHHRPDLIFLDIGMPEVDGFEFLKTLGKDIPFQIIFTTAFDQYAIQAIRLSALDYLLKPLQIEELELAIQKFRQRMTELDQLKGGSESELFSRIEVLLSSAQSNGVHDNKIALPTFKGFSFIYPKDIIRLEAQNYFTTFFMTDGNQIVVSRSMKECEEMLRPFNFIRVHASSMVNMKKMRRYIKGEGGSIEMEDGSMVDVSRRKKEEFMEAFKKL
jgi:two-component system LytT family response regulator